MINVCQIAEVQGVMGSLMRVPVKNLYIPEQTTHNTYKLTSTLLDSHLVVQFWFPTLSECNLHNF